jgi:hypothetical protein
MPRAIVARLRVHERLRVRSLRANVAGASCRHRSQSMHERSTKKSPSTLSAIRSAYLATHQDSARA